MPYPATNPSCAARVGGRVFHVQIIMANHHDTFGQGSSIPSLLNATSLELTSSLSDYRFTSVDLVVVRLTQLLDGHLMLNLPQGLLEMYRVCE